MNKERYPTNFLLILFVYIIAFFVGMSFIFSSISFGLASYADFYYILAIIIAPLILTLVYLAIPRIKFLWGHEHIMRLLISVLTLISIIFISIFLIPVML